MPLIATSFGPTHIRDLGKFEGPFGFEPSRLEACDTADQRSALRGDSQCEGSVGSSGYNFFDNRAGDISEPEIPAVVAIGQFFVIKAQQCQDRGMEVVHMDFVLYG